MSYPTYCDTPQGADPLNSWPVFSIVGKYGGTARSRNWFLDEQNTLFMDNLKREDEEITVLIMSIIQSGMLK